MKPHLSLERNYPAVPKACAPPPLTRWADALKGKKRGKKIIAGWEWDGQGPTILLILAPNGNKLQDIPHDVWSQMPQLVWERRPWRP